MVYYHVLFGLYSYTHQQPKITYFKASGVTLEYHSHRYLKPFLIDKMNTNLVKQGVSPPLKKINNFFVVVNQNKYT